MHLLNALKRRRYPIIGVAVAVFATSLAGAPLAQAAGPTDLYVVGTSDVKDSNLIASVIKPGFEAAYPQYSLQYSGSASLAAIQSAEAGNAAALLVHAASVENQFVAAGYSAEPFGRALFWGDFVLAGGTSDPAGVGANDPHDIVKAFERIAAAGAAGDAFFESRQGGSGTTIQEHAIWALAAGAPGLYLCKVSDANGGGAEPTTEASDGQDCGSTGEAKPDWYHSHTNATQSDNVNFASVCNYGQPEGTGNNCYVFTDRGTLNYKQSTHTADSLSVLVRGNSGDPANPNLLVNTFHGYVINPAKFSDPSLTKTDVTGGKLLLDWITSPAGQAAIGSYLAADPPFIPSAAPTITASALPASVVNETPFTVTGTLSNVVPGTPALAGKTVNLKAVPSTNPLAAPVTVASGTTDASGRFSISYAPDGSKSYSLGTDQITQTENASLNPIFADILQPTTKSLGTVATTHNTSKVSISSIKVSKKYSALITLKVSPTTSGAANIVQLYGRNSKTTSAGLHVLKVYTVKSGVKTIKIRYQLASSKHHHWKKLVTKLKVKYSGPQVTTSTSKTKTVVLH